MGNVGKRKRRSRVRRVGFHLAETMAAVSQIALLAPAETDTWVRRELNGSGRRQHQSARRG